MNLTLIDTVVTRSRALSPWTGFYFLQSLLINFALGYPFSLLYAVAFTCMTTEYIFKRVTKNKIPLNRTMIKGSFRLRELTRISLL